MQITLSLYNPQWPAIFQKEADLLETVLQGVNHKIEHMGSTAIKGLAAKPIIDILIGLENFETAEQIIPKITKLGYKYISKYEDLMPYRRFFTKEKNGIRTHHIHMVEIGTEFWKRHLAFRKHMRRNKQDRKAYEALKLELAARDWEDENEYANAKSEFIRRIEKKSIGLSQSQ
jgi:GrpB-like predicted nucleotidyltransferase (UPF0157 family)